MAGADLRVHPHPFVRPDTGACKTGAHIGAPQQANDADRCSE